jgi:hypothetical protein
VAGLRGRARRPSAPLPELVAATTRGSSLLLELVVATACSPSLAVLEEHENKQKTGGRATNASPRTGRLFYVGLLGWVFPGSGNNSTDLDSVDRCVGPLEMP